MNRRGALAVDTTLFAFVAADGKEVLICADLPIWKGPIFVPENRPL